MEELGAEAEWSSASPTPCKATTPRLRTSARSARGMQGLQIRLARRLNKALGRAGSVFADRYYAPARD